jgi:hypothetical protein
MMSQELLYTMHLNDGEFAVNVTDELASDLSAEEIRDVALERISRAHILFRQFSPFTAPEPWLQVLLRLVADIGMVSLDEIHAHLVSPIQPATTSRWLG